MTSMHTFDIAS